MRRRKGHFGFGDMAERPLSFKNRGQVIEKIFLQ